MVDSFLTGLAALWIAIASPVTDTHTSILAAVLETPALASAAEAPDPEAEAIVNNYLKAVSNRGSAPNEQGVWLQTGTHLLANHRGTVPLSAASLTKIATSLAALDILGLDHQFETMVGVTGPIQAGVVQGDLVIQGGGDPFFIWEEAIALGNTLNRIGIRKVTGDLVIVSDFYMNYDTDPLASGQLLKQGLSAKTWSPEVEWQFATLPAGSSRPQVDIAGQVRVARAAPFGATAAPGDGTRAATPIIRHYSLPLGDLLKLMNIYSNNDMAHMLASAVGGPSVVSHTVSKLTGIPQTEIQVVNGSGLGVSNRISPRASTAMIMVLQQRLQALWLNGKDPLLTVSDLLPISSVDTDGTLIGRHIPRYSAVKTGTLNTVSALAGVLPTRDRGLVWFAIINRGSDIEGLRVEQDRLLQALAQEWGSVSTEPPAIASQSRDTRQEIGNEVRNQVLLAPSVSTAP